MKTVSLILTTGFFLFFSSPIHGQLVDDMPHQHLGHTDHTRTDHTITFIQNKNQWNSKVRYKASIGAGTLFLEENAFTYQLAKSEHIKQIHDIKDASREEQAAFNIDMHAYRVEFVGASSTALTGSKKRSEYHNYILGDDPSQWASHVPLYEKVVYEDLYEGINLESYSHDAQFKYDFVVQAGVDPQQIKLRYVGVDPPDLEDGHLLIPTSVNTMVEQRPYAYQVIDGREQEVLCNYLLSGQDVSFEFPNGYDDRYTLVIDPTVVAATLSGTINEANFGHSATYDNQGNIYAGGISFGTGYPTNMGSYQINYSGGGTDIAVSKYNPTGSTLIFATYIGGADAEYLHSMVVDFNQQLHIFGTSFSANYPTTPNAVQSNASSELNDSDIIVTKLNADGSALVGSTFMGGNQMDGQNTSSLNDNYGDVYRGEIILDNQGNVYVASCSRSNDFPITNNAFNTTFNNSGAIDAPSQDGVVFKLNSDLSTLYWSTYLGEDQSDTALGLRLDDNNNVYVTGTAGHSNFPTTPGTIQPNWAGGREDAFVVLLSANGSSLLASTFWGTSGDEHSYFMDLDESGNVHIYGQTTGVMPITPNTFSFNPGSRQFLASFTPDLSTLNYSTVIGSGPNPLNDYDFVPVAFMVDKCDQIYFSGYYAVIGLPVTPDAIDEIDDTFYLGVLDSNASGFFYGTYYGDADHVDGGTSRFDKSGTVYQAVCSCTSTSSGVMNTLPNAHATTQSTFCDIGVFKIDFEINTVTAAMTALPATSGCAPFAVDFFYTGQDATNVFWDFDDDGNTSVQLNPSYTFDEAGTYKIMLIATSQAACNVVDTSFLEINVLDGSGVQSEVTLCDEQETYFLSATTTNATYNWQDGSTGATFTSSGSGVFWVDISIEGCTRRDSFVVSLENSLTVDLGLDVSFCDIPTYTIDASSSGGSDFLWENGSNLPTLTVANSGTYSVTVYDDSGCATTDEIEVTLGTTPVIDLGLEQLLCDEEVATLIASTPDATYQWQDGSTGESFDATEAGIYWVMVDNEGCVAMDSVEINYLAEINLTLESENIDCYPNCNGAIDITTLSGGNGPLNLVWNTGQNTNSLTDLCDDQYVLTVTDDLCTYTRVVNITQPDSLQYELSIRDVECFGDGDGFIQLASASGGTQPYLYSFQGEPFSNQSFINLLDGGNYPFVLTDANGCTQEEIVSVYEPPFTVVDAGPDLTMELGTSVGIDAIISPYFNQTVFWTPADSLDCITCMDPIANPTYTQRYTIMVTDTITGCVIQDDVLVRVIKNRNVYIPNVFTPNGDGSNDIFQIYTGNGVSRIHQFRVFDRWGEEVFNGQNYLPKIPIGWDGFFKGEEMNNAVFTYFAEIEFVDEEVIIYKGDVTLIK